MPLPKSRDPGKTLHILKKEHPEMPYKQRVAIALSQARKAGANIPKKPRKSMARFR